MPSLSRAGRRRSRTIKDGWTVVITHGNGPQVGFVLRRSELAAHELHEVPLDVCGADTQGAIGYALQQNLGNEFRCYGMDRDVVTVICQTEVAADDPAFESPTKPIGSFMDAGQAERRRREDGWVLVEDANRGYRRVVASPRPLRIVELPAIRKLAAAGTIVITAGGGGVPVVAGPGGELAGVPAVIDKDLASSLLASDLGADLLLITTGVEKIALNFGTQRQRWADCLTLAEAKAYLAAGTHFGKGSMAPKIQAMIEYRVPGARRHRGDHHRHGERRPRAERRHRNPDHPGLIAADQADGCLNLTGRDRAPTPGGRPARVLPAGNGRTVRLGFQGSQVI